MGILEPTLGLASRPGEDVDEEAEAEDDKRANLMGKDACLTPEFRDSMKLYLATSSSSPWPIIEREQIDAFKKNGGDIKSEGKEGKKEKPSRDPPTRKELDAYTQSSWDSVLHFLVGSGKFTFVCFIYRILEHC